MLTSPAEAAVRQPALSSAETLRRDERAGLESSRVLEVIATAEAERRANALPMPARVLSQLGADRSERGDRVRRVSHDHLAALGVADRRIFGAFEATR